MVVVVGGGSVDVVEVVNELVEPSVVVVVGGGSVEVVVVDSCAEAGDESGPATSSHPATKTEQISHASPEPGPPRRPRWR